MALPTLLTSSPDLNAQDAQLIWELVSDVSPKADVLARHGMTAQDLQRKTKSAMFRSAYSEARKLWNSDMNTLERIRVKSQFMLEDSLVDIFKIIKDEQQPAAVRLEGVKKLGELSQATNQKNVAAPERHQITINVGDKSVVIDHVAAALPAIEGEVA